MPTRQEFMGQMLPSKGLYCVVGIADKRIHSQTFHETLLDADVAIEALDSAGINSFIALANYGSNLNRTAHNAVTLKSFFLDLDCGEDSEKKYPDQGTALQDLKRFVKEMKLPRPMVVNSGNGVHAYWPLTQEVERTKWKIVAEALKRSCLLTGMKIDTSVPADAARILRAVDSHNFKDPLNPLPVVAMNAVAPVEFDAFRALLGVPDVALAAPASPRPLNDVMKSLMGNRPSSFKLILKKTMAGNGCQQVADAIENQDTLEEPMWRAALSIAQFCKDRDKAIHLISRDHPEYNFDDTEAKAQSIQGPYLCATFESNNPAACVGCKHKGTFKSPIALGYGEVEVANPEDNIIPDPQEPDRLYTIPTYPFPFVRGKNGGVYVRAKDDDNNPKDKMVYENDFYLVNTVDDPFHGMSALFRLHLPQDGIKEFLIPLRDMIAKDTFGGRVSRQGISTIAKQMESLMAYANMSVKKYQAEKRAEVARVQFGWADNFSAFIVGDREITASGVRYSPPSSVTLSTIKYYKKAGTLEEWKKIAAFYNRPGMELHMFTLFMGFGSPLVAFTPEKGGVVSLYSEGSGVGKTTTLKMINSIFGHPMDSMLIKEDTMNARMSRIGLMQHIAPTLDEITNEDHKTSSNFLYHFLQGRDKERLNRNAEAKTRVATWASICIVTANSALEDKLLLRKNNPDGEMARFLEFPYSLGTTVSKAESDAVFDKLPHNYGMAGERYIQYVIREMPKVVEAIKAMQVSLDTAAALRQRERNWSVLAAVAMTGGLIARAAGVLDFTDEDFARIHKWVVEMLITKRRESVKGAESADPSLLLGAFLSEHINDVLVIPSGALRKPGVAQEAALREPKGKLYIRYEPDSKLLYLNRTKFREFCTLNQVAYATVLGALRKQKLFLEEKKMRMGKGLQFSQPEIALVFNNAGEALFGEDEVIPNGNARSTN